MGSQTKLKQDEIRLIADHLDYCTRMAQRGLNKSLEAVAIAENKQTVGMREYWSTVISGLRWAKQQLSYRKEPAENATSESIQQLGGDSGTRRGDRTGDTDNQRAESA